LNIHVLSLVFFRFGPFFVAPHPAQWSYGKWCCDYEQDAEIEVQGSIHRQFTHIQASCEPG